MAAPRVFGRVRGRRVPSRLRVLQALKGQLRGSAVALVRLASAWTWIALFALAALIVASGAVRDLDHAALDVAQSVRSPALDLLGSLIGLLGQSEVTLGIALGLAVARFRRSRVEAIIPLFIVATIAVETFVKLVVPQVPPGPERSRTVELLPLLSVPFAHSFPSGHVARAAFLLRVATPIPTWLVVAGVVAMALSRIYLGEHWLSDTVGGALLGIGTANIARQLIDLTRKGDRA